jgi:hypothetical protein
LFPVNFAFDDFLGRLECIVETRVGSRIAGRGGPRSFRLAAIVTAAVALTS